MYDYLTSAEYDRDVLDAREREYERTMGYDREDYNEFAEDPRSEEFQAAVFYASVASTLGGISGARKLSRDATVAEMRDDLAVDVGLARHAFYEAGVTL